MEIGTVTHYYGKIGVAIVELSAPLKVGDRVKFQGHGVEFEQPVASLEVEHAGVPEASTGQQVGLKVDQPVKEGTLVSVVE